MYERMIGVIPTLTQQFRRMLKQNLAKISHFLLHYEYLDAEKLQGFTKYRYKGVDTNPFNNFLAMPFCDIVVKCIPRWLAPNVLTLTTFVLSLVQYLLLAYYDYYLYASADEVQHTDRIPNWVWFFSGCVLLACLFLDALDGKHARRIGACSPVGEILDHSIDTWRLTAPAITCFYSMFGKLQYGVPGYRLLWLVMATQSVVAAMFWQQYVCGYLVYNWGYDIMQYMMAWFYFHTWYREGADYWQCEGWYFGTNAVITEKWTHLMIFGVALPMQIYSFIRHLRSDESKSLKPLDFIRPAFPAVILLIVAFILSQRNLYDSVIEEDPRILLWLVGIIFCNITWHLLIAIMTKTTPPWWNHALTAFVLCTFYWYVRPRSLLQWDELIAQIVAVSVTLVHLHLVVCTLNQMCDYFGIYLFSVKTRKTSQSRFM